MVKAGSMENRFGAKASGLMAKPGLMVNSQF